MYVYLDIAADFTCQMCGRCCRNDWQVTLTEESYQRNKCLFESTGREKEFAEAFIPLAGSGGLDEYAYIAKQANGACWFLAAENYCRLHREAGHSHLDAVCQLFPRYPMSTARGQELTLSFSCPAVLNLASRKAPLMVIRAEEPPLEVLAGQFVAHVYPHQQSEGNPLRYYFEMEQHFIDIMQWRSVTVNERLQILGETVERIRQLENCDRSMLGTNLTAIFYKNYEHFDACPVQLADNRTEFLLENFFVNLIFKKVFYIYGLQRALTLLDKAAKHIELLRARAVDSQGELAALTQGIMDVEFQYGHNRQALL
ncbi:MAG: flagellin lysine-N-methylase [Pelosinus sp.]|nr:flagellin lysine-N-methylase [Pelosinus sp.]